MAIDPLSEVIAFLRPRAVFSKVIGGAGRWAVRYSDFGQPSFCAVLEGGGLLAVVGQEPIRLMAGDFVLLPATPGFTLSSLEPGTPIDIDAQAAADDRSEGEIRHGRQSGHAEVRMLGGYFAFASPDSALLVSLLPAVVHVRRVERLATLVALVRQESLQQRSGRELILTRLVEILLIEALRAAPEDSLAAPGLLRGLADSRLVAAFRSMHADPARAWTVEQLAHQSALSRSAFFERFSRNVGLPPMEYLLAWRMALAKNLLRRKELAIAEVAEQVGYASSSTFSTAFSRHVGQPPGQYARTN
ncbi:AraC family transcriptional regulator [Ottowia sp.]|uniref:AraC family transcriptional regulator n=1 Tax=Ottowia sp. TaxID=1898956 RepID=UPI0025E3A2DF|nr:AraC family transcriptional regulator [Ottowia sp.]MBK6745265.1 AraC family transcriptional regulator [Ottowia sp.]